MLEGRGPAVADRSAHSSFASTATLPAPRGERLLSLDVFRGLTIAAMLLVNTPGSWSAVYAPLRHAQWHGWTPTDLIFPFFLFVVGITTCLSLSARKARGDSDAVLVRQILRRGAIIFLLGLLIAASPFCTEFRLWPPGASCGAAALERLAAIRIPGVLQRIAIAYVITALLFLRTGLRAQLAIIAVILMGYWMLMTLVPVPGHGPGALMLDDPSRNLAAWLDRLLLEGHLWPVTRTWDPEGVLSTIPAIGTTLLGLVAGRWIASPRPLMDRIAGLFAAGAIAMVVGLMWNWVFPINKNLWTSSYVVFTGGMACVTLATCMWVIDAYRLTGWTRPFVIFGVNPILAYVGSMILARLLYTTVRLEIDGRLVPVQTVIYRTLFESWLAPRNASLAFAVVYVLLWLGILTLLWRRRVFLKV